MNRITTLPQLQALQNETWVYSFIVATVAILVAMFVANLISWNSRTDKSYVKRRIWFIVIGIIAYVGFFLFNDLYVKSAISQQGWQAMYSQTNIFSSMAGLATYYVVGLILMFVRRHSKFGSILGKEKEKK